MRGSRKVRIIDRKHDALKLVAGGNHLRSIRNPRTILDLGTGKGAWAFDIAREFATADEVVGVDIEATDSSAFPPNCRFEVSPPEF
jgi:ubiquinone/menaquinone biosynthesis C-methylase UbiE